MLVVAQHTITDPTVFWPTAAEAPLPADARLLQVLPSTDGLRAVCLWQAPSVERVREIVDGTVGHVSRNEFFAVEEQTAVGISVPTAEPPDVRAGAEDGSVEESVGQR